MKQPLKSLEPFFKFLGKYWKAQTFFSPGFLLEDIHSNSSTPINRQAELVASPQGTTNHNCLVPQNNYLRTD